MFVGIGIIALPDDSLAALIGRNNFGSAHVRVPLHGGGGAPLMKDARRSHLIRLVPAARTRFGNSAEMGLAAAAGPAEARSALIRDAWPERRRGNPSKGASGKRPRGPSLEASFAIATSPDLPSRLEVPTYEAASEAHVEEAISSATRMNARNVVGDDGSAIGAEVILPQPNIGYLPVLDSAEVDEKDLTWREGRAEVYANGLMAEAVSPEPDGLPIPLAPEPVRSLRRGSSDQSTFGPEDANGVRNPAAEESPIFAAFSSGLARAWSDADVPAVGAVGFSGQPLDGEKNGLDLPDKPIAQAGGQAAEAAFSLGLASGEGVRAVVMRGIDHSKRTSIRNEAISAQVFDVMSLEAAASGLTLEMPRLIKLRSLIEALREKFDVQELEQIAASRAANNFLSIERLRSAGIHIRDELPSEQTPLNLVSFQTASQQASGGESADSADGGSGGGLGLKQSLTATASAGFDSRPFLAQGGDAEAVSLRLLLAPTLERSSARSTLILSGQLEHIEYLRRYDSLQNYGIRFGASRQMTERLEIEGGLSFRSSVLATNLANPFDDLDQELDNSVPPIGNDVTILGEGRRRTQYGANGGLTFILSDRDQLRWTASARADRFNSGGLVESNFLAQRLQYSRRLGETLTVGAAIDANLIDFTGTGREGAQTVSPQLQVTAGLAPRLTLTGSLGVSVTRLEFDGLEETTTALAGNVAICRQGERSNLCVNGSRQVLPGAIGGALLQTRGGFSYSLRLSERDTLSLSGNYATASQPIPGTTREFESVNGFARYERQLDERLRLFASAGVLNTAGNRPTDVTNIQGLIGVSLQLGQSR